MSVRRRVEHLMGMPISLALRGRHADTPTGDQAWLEVVEQLRAVDRVFSTYRADSSISRLAAGELRLADCPVEVAEVLELGRLAQEQSGGAFSIHLPGADGRPRLDPSGVVKGWAVERAAKGLGRLDETDWCLSAGGDLVCHTTGPDSPAWRIGIEDPRDPRMLIAVVPVRSGAVATSGTAHRGAHLVDPRTGLAPTAVASVTVIGPSLTWADIDATAAYVQGPDAVGWLRQRPIGCALIVAADGTTTRLVGAHRPGVRTPQGTTRRPTPGSVGGMRVGDSIRPRGRVDAPNGPVRVAPRGAA